MALAANGSYNAQYRVMLTNLFQTPAPIVAIRPGWEGPGGNWYPWSVGSGGTNATYANYINAFKNIAIIAKSINPNVLIDFCGAWGYGSDILNYWPGAYDATNNPGGADIISLDVYGGNVDVNNGGNHAPWAAAQSFTGLARPSGSWSLDTMVAFAKQQGVKVGMGEYGPGTAAMSAAFSGGEGSGIGSNDGNWAQDCITWINSLGSLFAYTVWSPWPPADDLLAPDTDPAEQTVWKTMWGQTHFQRSLGNWYHGNNTPSER